MLSDGRSWQSNRRFALKVLRDFGFGKSSIVDRIEFEVNHLVNLFKSKHGQPIDVDTFLNVSILNTLLQLIFGSRAKNVTRSISKHFLILGKRYEIDDPELNLLVKIINENLTKVDQPGMLFLSNNTWSQPIVHLPFVKDLIGVTSLIKTRDTLFDFFQVQFGRQS